MSDTVNEKDLRTNSNKYNKNTDNNQLIHEEISAIENYAIIREAFENGRAKDICLEPKKTGPAFILGSGASLDLALPKLKNWKGGIVCTTSHALSLMYYGIEPDYIIALDPFCCWDEIAGVDWSKTKTKLVTTPTVWPTLIKNWPNEIILYLQNNGKRDSFYATTLKRMYSIRKPSEGSTSIRDGIFNHMARTEIILFACSPAMQLFIANILGYSPIFTAGCDFAYTFDKNRFSDYTIKDGVWTKNDHPLEETLKDIEEYNKRTDIEQKRLLIKTVNGLLSEEVHVYYKKNFYSAWRLSETDLFSTDYGACIELPHADIDEVILNNKWPEPISKQEIARISEEYLASISCFVIESNGGKNFVEVNNIEPDLLNYITSLNRIYKCSICGASLTASDDINHHNTECPVCHDKEGLKKMVDIDVQGNMDRVKSRLKAVTK
jgi:DNA-directed RNA polymerase subunit RPC12/RpoP